MARKLHTSLLLTGTLETMGPLHVGGAGEGIEVDMPLATNGRGERYLPGTSLAGVLRSWMESMNDTTVKEWFGFQGPGDDNGNASWIFVEDAPITLPGGMESEVWHGVGIDRQWGTAATGIKFSREVLPKGTIFPLELRLDVTAQEGLTLARAALWHLAKALESGQILLGAATTRGLGRVKFQGPWQANERDWSSRQGVLHFLGLDTSPSKVSNNNVWKEEAGKVNSLYVSKTTVDITITWEPVGPLMTKAPRDGLVVDALPMLSASGDKLAMVLPGSSIKGVLRAQAERIVRTLLERDVSQEEGPTRHLEQLAVPLVDELFGRARPHTSKEAETSPPGQRGALSVPSCYATNSTVTPAQWATITDTPATETNATSPLLAHFRSAGIGNFQHAFHVAVDRWTGGAADQMLFSAVEPFGVTWEPIQLRLHLQNLETKEAAMALLWLLLRDLWEGNLGLGFGVNRGYGAIKVSMIELRGLNYLRSSFSSTSIQLDIKARQISNLELIQPCLDCLQLAWHSWLSNLTEAEL